MKKHDMALYFLTLSIPFGMKRDLPSVQDELALLPRAYRVKAEAESDQLQRPVRQRISHKLPFSPQSLPYSSPSPSCSTHHFLPPTPADLPPLSDVVGLLVHCHGHSLLVAVVQLHILHVAFCNSHGRPNTVLS